VTSNQLAVVSRDQLGFAVSQVDLGLEVALFSLVKSLLGVISDWDVVHIRPFLNVETDLTPELVLQFLDWKLAIGVVNLELTVSNLILVIEVTCKNSLSLGHSLGTAATSFDILIKFFGQIVNTNWELSHNNLSLVLGRMLESSTFELNLDDMLNLGLWLLSDRFVLKLEGGGDFLRKLERE
jgi:hypothetical protein